MKKGELVTGTVERIDFPNRSVVRTEDGGTIRTKNALPQQTVTCRVKKSKNENAEGTLVDIIRRSFVEEKYVSRGGDVCPHFALCGGCLYQSIPYDEECRLKEEQMKRIFLPVFQNAGLDLDAVWEGLRPSPVSTGYRNKMEFSFGDCEKGGKLTLGMHRRNSFYDIVTTDGCRIIDADMRTILRVTLDYFSGRSVTYRHKKTQEGYLRHLLVRKAARTGEILVDLVHSGEYGGDGSDCTASASDGRLDETALLQGWRDALLTKHYDGELRGILHTKNDRLADVIADEGTEILFGDNFFYEEILGLRFRITSFSFFQTNSLGAEVLYGVAREYLLSAGGTIYDLYSGTGTIAQLLAPVAKTVIGVEIVEEAVEAARENAKINGLTNCEFIAGDVLKVLNAAGNVSGGVENNAPETKFAAPTRIVLDPPRDGVHPKALPKILVAGANEMLYISCKPTSLARDLPAFFEAGYEVERMCAVDLFPRTGNCEVVAKLKK